jgi:hypothetical protein
MKSVRPVGWLALSVMLVVPGSLLLSAPAMAGGPGRAGRGCGCPVSPGCALG